MPLGAGDGRSHRLHHRHLGVDLGRTTGMITGVGWLHSTGAKWVRFTTVKRNHASKEIVAEAQHRMFIKVVGILNFNITRGETWRDYNAAENKLLSSSSVAFISLMLVSWNMAGLEIILVMFNLGRSRPSFLL